MNIRLFCDASISLNSHISLCADHFHYLKNVLRVEIGSDVYLFNSSDGEWRCSVLSYSKLSAIIIVRERIKAAFSPPKHTLTLAFCLVKPDKQRDIITKCTEVGVNIFSPLLSQNTVVRNFNHRKCIAHAIEATEQCGRIDVPDIVSEPILLSDFIKSYDGYILFCSEQKDGIQISSIKLEAYHNLAVLIGPEGGFTQEETFYLKSLPNIKNISLSGNTLRSETAAIIGCAAAKAILTLK